MTAPRAFTSMMELVTRCADAAVERPGGVSIIFTSAKYGIAGSKKQARSFQQSFYAQMARLRRKDERKLGEDVTNPRDSDARGAYDKLVLYVLPLDDNEGWKCEMAQVEEAFLALDIVDNATGKPLREVSAEHDERAILINKATGKQSSAHFTRADFDRLTELDLAWMHEDGRPNLVPWYEMLGKTRESYREHGAGAGTVLTPEPPSPRVDEFEALLEGDGDLFGEGEERA